MQIIFHNNIVYLGGLCDACVYLNRIKTLILNLCILSLLEILVKISKEIRMKIAERVKMR